MSFRLLLTSVIIAAVGLVVASVSVMTLRPKTTSGDLAAGDAFEVVGELYALSIATDLNARKPDLIAVVPLPLRGPEILSVRPIPHGSTIRIVRKGESRWPTFLYPDRYYVESQSIDNEAGLPVVLDLAQGNEGGPSVLNPVIYRPLN